MTVAPLRVARGTAVATVAVLLAGVGHLAAAGPGAALTPLVVAGALLVLVGCIVASARSWTPARLVVALLGVQVVGHLALTGPAGPVDPRLAALAPAAHAHSHGAVLSPTMIGAHLAAAALAALLLARVDTAVTTLWHLARHAAGALRLEPVLVPALVLPSLAALAPAPAGRRTSTVPSRRGPPVLARP